MQSKTSFFNGTVFKKNMARFAPVWLLYTLALLLAMAMMYINDGQAFWFANRMGEMIQYASLINLFYAPAVAMLLFGDLYNSRMCNALHAMPMKRSCWFCTNAITGLLFSLIPTAVFCGVSVPLLLQTCVVDSWQIALWTWLGMNLSFLCFYGIALFSVFCAGNRFAMLAVYAILNGGAYIVYFLIDAIYTPMLYGVVTPSALAENLTPIANLIEAICLETDSYHDVYAGSLENVQANFHLYGEGWMAQGIWAVVGAGFTVLAWLMYRKRSLECAGDTMATKALEPVFQICVSVCGAAFFSLFTSMFLGWNWVRPVQYLFLGSGLMVGWFAGRMLLERTVRVFRLKNFLGLATLAAVLAGSLAATHYDIFGIETWTPNAENVKSVTFGYSMYRGMSEELTEKADIAEVIRLQELALQDRVEDYGSHVILDGQRVYASEVDKEERKGLDWVYSTSVYIHYTMDSGKEISREYIIWGDGETGEIVNEYLSRWEVVRIAGYYDNVEFTAEEALEDSAYTRLWVNGVEVPMEYRGTSAVESLLDAIQADCAERTMTQRETFHTGHFERIDEEGETEAFRSFWIEFSTDLGKDGNFSVYADSENTLKWLSDRDLIDFTVHPENGYAG